MSPKALNEVLSYKMISESTIDYLKEHKNSLVENALKNVRTNELFKRQLDKDNNLFYFKDSILNDEDGHITWIQKDLYAPEQISFTKYNRKTLKKLNPIYCLFYKELKKVTLEKVKDANISKALIGYFNGFIKGSC